MSLEDYFHEPPIRHAESVPLRRDALRAMSLSFPNQSRSYDQDRHRIRFWGHDDALEVPFFLDENVIFKIAPRTANLETAILAAFDSARDRIMAAAAKVYAPALRRPFYVLAVADF